MNELTTGEIISQGLSRGLKNMVAIAVNFLLWIVTVWIPYLNIGTTIGLFVGIVAKSSRDEPISYTEIFNPVYRKRMGDFFLVTALSTMGISIGLALFLIPGIVLGIAWMLAALLTVDGGLNPIDAIKRSNAVTYGKKAAIFWAMVVIELIICVGVFVLNLIFGHISSFLGGLIVVVFEAFAMSFVISAQGFIYSRLKDAQPDEPLA